MTGPADVAINQQEITMGQPTSPAVSDRYRAFTEWVARLDQPDPEPGEEGARQAITLDHVIAAAKELAGGCATSNDEWTIEARATLNALTERGHGLAPVVAHQWSVRYPDGFVDRSSFTEAGARQRAAELGGEVVYRAVGPWIRVEVSA